MNYQNTSFTIHVKQIRQAFDVKFGSNGNRGIGLGGFNRRKCNYFYNKKINLSCRYCNIYPHNDKYKPNVIYAGFKFCKYEIRVVYLLRTLRLSVFIVKDL